MARKEFTTLTLTNKWMMRKLTVRYRLVAEATPCAPEGLSETVDEEETRETAMAVFTMMTGFNWKRKWKRRWRKVIRSPISQSCLSHYMRASCCSHSMQQLRGKRILSKNSPNRFSHWCQMEKELRRGDKEELTIRKKRIKRTEGSQRTSETATEMVPVLYSNYFLRTATVTPVCLLQGISTASIAANALASSTTPTALSTATDCRNHHISSPTACQLPISTGDFDHTNTTACTIIYCKCFWDTSMLKF